MARRFTQQEVAKLIEAAVAPLRAEIARLEAKVEQLETENARLKKNSSTSSKPPSSDIVKPPPPPLPGGKRKKRRRGGQPNHPRHVRPLFPPEQVDHTETYELPGLSPDWEPLDKFRILQQAELVEKLFEVTEHRARWYRRFTAETDAVLQFCWAHLIRDVKYLTTLSDAVTRRFGEKLLGKIKVLFRVWHGRETTPQERWQRQAASARQEILHTVRRAPCRTETLNIAQRFRDHGPYYFTFLDRSGVEPTNNGIERQFRFLIVDRKVSQGTRGEAGRRWCERIWTVLATCAQRARSAFVYLREAILAYLHGQEGPSLLALPP